MDYLMFVMIDVIQKIFHWSVHNLALSGKIDVADSDGWELQFCAVGDSSAERRVAVLQFYDVLICCY